MSYQTEPLREHPSAYFVQNRDDLEEIKRLAIQDRMLTLGMGGVLPELADPGSLRRVLDVGCGTGGWLMDLAHAYPSIEKLFGVDISGKMLSATRSQAEHLGLGSRVRFETMDALRILDFPNASFDLVNQRLGVSWIRTWEWTKLLLEYQRVCRPGGIIRLTEADLAQSNSPALTQLCELSLQACFHSARFFESRHDGITSKLVFLLTQHGIEEIRTQVHTLTFQAGTEAHQSFCEDMRQLYRVALPFFHKWVRVPNDYEEIYEQALKEMQQPDFVATCTLLTAWGKRSHGELPLMRGLP